MNRYFLLDAQNKIIGFEELPLGVRPAQKHRIVTEEDDVEALLKPQSLKMSVRQKIRDAKDLEDDLTDQKKLLQFMARGFAGLWQSLPQEVKDANPYKSNFDLFSQAIVNTDFRLDLETDQVAKISKILQDEANYAQIVNEEYLSKL